MGSDIHNKKDIKGDGTVIIHQREKRDGSILPTWYMRIRIPLPQSKGYLRKSTNEINETYYSKNNKLKIGDFQKNDFDLVLFDMTFINNSLKEKGVSEVDGIIGGDILNELNVCINYKKKEISLEF